MGFFAGYNLARDAHESIGQQEQVKQRQYLADQEALASRNAQQNKLNSLRAAQWGIDRNVPDAQQLESVAAPAPVQAAPMPATPNPNVKRNSMQAHSALGTGNSNALEVSEQQRRLASLQQNLKNGAPTGNDRFGMTDLDIARTVKTSRDRLNQLQAKDVNVVPMSQRQNVPPSTGGATGSWGDAPSTAGNFDAFKQAIFGQESGNGAADTSQPNYAGALGKGQILEKTFNGLKAQGKIPQNYDWRNPAHNEAASVAYMQEAWQATGGNPQLAAAYYYGGPGAVNNGAIVTRRDPLNASAPTTNQYAQQVLSRMGNAVSAAIPSANAAQPVAQAPAVPQYQGQPGAVPRTQLLNEHIQLAQMKMNEIRAVAQHERDPAVIAKMKNEYMMLENGIRSAQVQDLAYRAIGDNGALSQLAQLGGVRVAMAGPNQYVLLDQSGAASNPMSRQEIATYIYRSYTPEGVAMQQQMAAKAAEQNAKTQGELLLQAAKGGDAAALEQLKALMKQHDPETYDLKFNPMTGDAWSVGNRGTNYQIQTPPNKFGGVQPTAVPVQR